MKRWPFVVLLTLTLSRTAAQQHFWMSPHSVRPQFWTMFQPGARWDTVKSMIHVFSMHVNSLQTRDTALITQAVRVLAAASLKVNFEVGGLRPFSGCDSLAGERHAQLELSGLAKWVSRGGRVDYVSMDSPINSMIRGGAAGNCGWSVAMAARELADYMHAVRAYLPDVAFDLIEPVPWYSVGPYPPHPGNNYGELRSVLDTVLSIVRAGGDSITCFIADSPYDYCENQTTQGWRKLKLLEDYVKAEGLRYGLIYNSNLGGVTSDQLFYEQTLDGWRKYKNVGGNPDDVGVWSWYQYPALDFPETQQYTFTYTCKEFFNQVLIAPVFAKFEPPDGKRYHGTQTVFSSHVGYLAALNDSTIQPAVRGMFLSIPGTRLPANTFNGLRSYFASADSFGFIPEVGLFLVTSSESPTGATDSIIAVSTQYDYFLDSVISICRNYGRRMFVRIGGEFNGWWNGGGYHPYYFVTAFRKITNMYAARGFRDSIATVWCYEPDAPNNFDSVGVNGPLWYPGDTYVDWFGLDVFNAEHFDQSLPDSARGGLITRKGKSERFLTMARSKHKPVYLNETSAAGVNITTDSIDSRNDWNGWFAKFWEFMDNHTEIKGFNYISQNWAGGPNPQWGDARIQNSLYVTHWYRQEMRRPRYIHLRGSLPTSAADVPDVQHAFELYQNYPNPFNPVTNFQFAIVNPRLTHGAQNGGQGQLTIVKVYDVLGREVATLVNEVKQPGTHTVQWNASGMASGVYFCRLSTATFVQIRKLVLLR